MTIIEQLAVNERFDLGLHTINDGLELICFNRKNVGFRVDRKYMKYLNSQNKSLLNNHCVYFLVENNIKREKNTFYVGQTTKTFNRLKDHDKNKRDWNEALVFTEMDVRDIEYLESVLIDELRQNKRIQLTNISTPDTSSRDKFDTSIADKCKCHIYDILKSLRYLNNNDEETSDIHLTDVSINQGSIIVEENMVVDIITNMIGMIFHITGKQFHATMNVVSDDEYLVVEGSTIDEVHISYRKNAQKTRDKYRDYFEKRDGILIVTKSISFRSPSTAAEFVCGYVANGYSRWQDEKGHSFGKIQDGGRRYKPETRSRSRNKIKMNKL